MRWLRAEAPHHGVATGKLIVSGWSAGGHLTAMALAAADAGLAIRGILDIEPCRLNYLNAALKMNMDEQCALSPISHTSMTVMKVTADSIKQWKDGRDKLGPAR